MTSKNIFFLLAALFGLTLTSCEEKDYESYPPTWKGFLFEKNGQNISANSLRAGDQVTVTAVQDKQGHLIDATNYYWHLEVPVYKEDGTTVAEKDSVIEHSTHTNYDGLSKANPTFTFTIPKNACCGKLEGKKVTLTFQAKFNFSGNGIQIENEGGSYMSGLAGNIYPSSGSMAGGAKGTYSFQIHSLSCGH